MTAAAEIRRLYKSRTDKMIDGVCGGIAEYFAVDSTLVRLAFVFLIFMGGMGLLLYFIGMIILPANARAADEPPAAQQEHRAGQNTTFWAILLIALGLFWFSSNIGLGFWHHWWGMPWHVAMPLLLILAGVAFLLHGRDGTQPVQADPARQAATPRLYRSRTETKISGVCGGIAAYVNTDPTLVRILFIVAGFASAGFIIPLYIIMAIVVPKEPVVAPAA
jgi:phage shock protein C